MALLAILFSLSPTMAAFAASNGGGNTANVGATIANTEGGDPIPVNIENQTIVGEGSNNNVIITNTTDDAPSPTGIFMANAPIFIIGAFVVAGAVVVVARAKKKAGDDDE